METTTDVSSPGVIAEPDTHKEEQRDHAEYKNTYNDTTDGVKGFLHVVCERCGAEKSFFSKENTSYNSCTCCGKGMNLHKDDFRMMYLNCECGSTLYSKTNSIKPEFDVVCKDCGAPVAVQWNSKRKCYETMRR